MDDAPGDREVDTDAFRNLWETVHGRLTDDQRRSFLARQEVQTLAGLPDRAVFAAVPRSPKLTRICQIATNGAWWYEGAPCEEDNLAWCARCKPHPYPAVVVMTRGWSGSFHRSAECGWLIRFMAKARSPTEAENLHRSRECPCKWHSALASSRVSVAFLRHDGQRAVEGVMRAEGERVG